MLRSAIAGSIVLISVACVSPSPFDCPDLRTLERQTELRTFRHANGSVLASGPGLPADRDDEFEYHDGNVHKRAVPAMRSGKWVYWYPDGTKQAEVTYALGCYIQCCTAGYCPQIHDYPVGDFLLWYPSGRKLGEGSFVTVTRHVDTSCEGGDDTKAGRVSRSSRFWREDGSAITLEEARASGYLLSGW